MNPLPTNPKISITVNKLNFCTTKFKKEYDERSYVAGKILKTRISLQNLLFKISLPSIVILENFTINVSNNINKQSFKREKYSQEPDHLVLYNKFSYKLSCTTVIDINFMFFLINMHAFF